MALPWVRLDTNWYSNPKFLMLIEDKKWRAIAVYMASIGYSGGHGTDGFLPQLCLPHLHGTRKEALELMEVGLWNPSQGGWDINDWAEYQQSSEENAERSKRAKLAAQARWAKRAAGDDL